MTTVALLLFAAPARAQNLPPFQTINPNQVACNAINSQGAVTECRANISYGCASGTTSTQILATGGGRTALQFQNTGSVPIVLCFGDTCMGSNGFVIGPGNSYSWGNIGLGNLPGRISSSSVSIVSTAAGTCSFMFMD
jgi:hypothetical protein